MPYTNEQAHNRIIIPLQLDHFCSFLPLFSQGDYQCEYYYREALRINPNYTMAWSNLGLVLLNTSKKMM